MSTQPQAHHALNSVSLGLASTGYDCTAMQERVCTERQVDLNKVPAEMMCLLVCLMAGSGMLGEIVNAVIMTQLFQSVALTLTLS